MPMVANTVVYQIEVQKLGNKSSKVFVGDEGYIFYDPTVGDLRISNDETPGGIPLLQALNGATANGSYSGGNGASGNTTPGANTIPVDPTVIWNYTLMEAEGVINYGNVKQGFQTADHFGWVLLNGRALTTLTATQQAMAARLGWTGNMPNATGRITKMKGSPGTLGGSDTTLLLQVNLPNTALNGTASIPNYTRGGVAAVLDGPDDFFDQVEGTISAPVSVNLNPGAQTPTTVENAFMSLNSFVYLGA